MTSFITLDKNSFQSVITATITAFRSGDIAQNEVKKLAWYSFSRSIGIQLNKK
jgi:hypothetical protein